MKSLQEYCNSRKIKYKLTDQHGGHTENKPLKIVYIDRFLHDHDIFIEHGYIPIVRPEMFDNIDKINNALWQNYWITKENL